MSPPEPRQPSQPPDSPATPPGAVSPVGAVDSDFDMDWGRDGPARPARKPRPSELRATMRQFNAMMAKGQSRMANMMIATAPCVFSGAESLAVASLMDQPATTSEIAGRLGWSVRWAQKVLRGLVGISVVRKRRKRWTANRQRAVMCEYCLWPEAATPCKGALHRKHRRRHSCGPKTV